MVLKNDLWSVILIFLFKITYFIGFNMEDVSPNPFIQMMILCCLDLTHNPFSKVLLLFLTVIAKDNILTRCILHK